RSFDTMVLAGWLGGPWQRRHSTLASGPRRSRPRAHAALPRALARRALRRSGIAHGQRLPDVPVGLVPVHEASAAVAADPHVGRAVRPAPVRDAARLDPREDAIEVGLAHAKAVVLDGDGAVGLIE